MSYNFPDAPVDGEVYQGYVWNAAKGAWEVQGAATSGAVRYDTPQGLTGPQQTQGRDNIGAVARIGDTMSGVLTSAPSIGNIAAASGLQAFEVRSGGTAGDAALMTFHRPGAFAVYFGVDTDNALKLGGFSAGAVAYSLFHEGNLTPISYTAQGPSEPQKEQARANIGVPDANVIINGDFRVNQIGYVSAAALAAGAYGHDQWKAGASGGDYSFTQLKNSTQITIASGKSIIQPIEDVFVVGGSYVLSWTGTAQARAGVNTLTPSGAYAASPLLISGQTAGTVMSVEFNTGTLGTVKLERGSVATPFVMRPYDQELLTCQRYFQRIGVSMAFSAIGAGSVVQLPINFLVVMRGYPTMSNALPDPLTSSSSVNLGGAGSATITPHSFSFYISSAAAGTCTLLGYYVTADARIY